MNSEHSGSMPAFSGHSVRCGEHTERISGLISRRMPVTPMHGTMQVTEFVNGDRLPDCQMLCRLLAAPGPVDTSRLLAGTLSVWKHFDRLAALHVVPKAAPARFRAQQLAARELSGRDLAAAFSGFTSPEMDILQTSLLSRLRNGLADREMKACIEVLFDLKAVLLREISARISPPAGEGRDDERRLLVEAVRRCGFVIRFDTKLLFDGILTHPDRPVNDVLNIAGSILLPSEGKYLEQRKAIEEGLLPALDGQEKEAAERSVCDVLQTLQRKGGLTRTLAGRGFHATLVLRPEVFRHRTVQAKDLFHEPGLRINPARRLVFYRLLDGSGLSTEVVSALRDEDSPEHRQLEAWFDGLEGTTGLTTRALLRHPRGLGIRLEYDVNRFNAVLVGAFGDRSSGRRKTAPADALEELLFNLGDFRGPALAVTTLRSLENRPDIAMVPGLNCLEMRIPDAIIPSRDVEEIRIPLSEFPDATTRRAAVLRARAVSAATGIRIRFFGDPLPDSASPSPVEPPADPKVDEAVADPMRLVRTWLAGHPELSGEVAASRVQIDGPALGLIAGRLSRFVDGIRAGQASCCDRTLLQRFMDEEGGEIVKAKIRLMHVLDGLPCSTPLVHRVLERWLLSAYRPLTEDELRFIFRTSTAVAGLLVRFLDDEAVTPAGFFPELEGLLRELDPASDVFARSSLSDVPPEERILPVFSRLSFTTVSMLAFGSRPLPPQDLKRLFLRLNAPRFAGCGAALGLILQAPELSGTAGTGRLSRLVDFMNIFMQVLGMTVETETRQDPEPFEMPGPMLFSAPLGFVPEAPRRILSELAPELAARLNALHPGHRPFPAARRPERLPQTENARRQFLLKALDFYRPGERGFDKRLLHGRLHAIRTALFGLLFCGLAQEQGVMPDVAAVFCAALCHDAGRRSSGFIHWERECAQTAVEAVRSICGADAAGEAWEKAFHDMILADLPGETLESLLVKAADSLEAGRTDGRTAERFLLFREEKDPFLQKLKEQIITEADRLQRITSVKCANRRSLEARRNALINLSESPDAALKRFEALQHRIDRLLDEERALSNAELLEMVLNPVRHLPELFPILNRYLMRFWEELPEDDARDGLSR